MTGLLISVTRSSLNTSPLCPLLRGRIALLVLLAFALAGNVHSQQFAITTVAGNGQTSPPLQTAPSPGWISGIAADAAGNVFIAVSDTNVVMRLDPQGNLTVVAGTTGVAGYSGDGGLATSAQLNTPVGIALDSQGNLYIADSGNQRVRQVGTNGVINTVAGNGTNGGNGDNGPATFAQLSNPIGISLDGFGNLYILELAIGTPNCTFGPCYDVRKVSNGTISTVQVTVQGLSYPFFPYGARNIAVDSSGNIYWSEPQCFVWEFQPGTPSFIPIAGPFNTQLPCVGFSGDGGPATNAQLNGSIGVAVDSSGNVYIADANNNRIREVSNGIITTVAGSGSLGIGGDGGPATSAALVSPALVAIGAPGTFYVVDAGNQRVRKVTNGVISTLIGNVLTSSGNGIPATSATLSLAPNVAADSSGNLYIAEAGSHVVRQVSNGIITTVAGNGTQGYSGDGGPPTNAQLSGPLAVALSPTGDMYIADTGNNRIRKVSNGIITTVAGNGTIGYSGDNGPAINAQLKFPTGLVVDAAGNLYISDTGNNVVRKVSNGVITRIAGNSQGISGTQGDGGPAVNAYLIGPAGLALDTSGNLYIADSSNYRIRKISNGIITTVAGMDKCCISPTLSPTHGFNGDNIPATTALLNYPVGVAVDSSGNIYIADGLNQRIRKVSNGIITTIAGNGTIGYGGDDGPASGAILAWPTGVAVDGMGNVYVADTGNRRIRAISAGTPPSCTLSIQGGSSALTVSATASCTDSNATITATTINWGDGSQLTPGTSGNHTYAAAGTYTITVTATNNFAQQGTASQTVTLTAPTSVTAVFPGQDTATMLSVTAPPNTTTPPPVTFKCTQASGPSGSTTDPQGTYGISCTFSPPTATLSTTPVTVMMTVQTTGTTVGLLQTPGSSGLRASLALWIPFPAMVLLGSGLFGSVARRGVLIRCVALGLVIVLLLISTSCGGGFTPPAQITPPPSQAQTPPGNYTLTVAAVDSKGFVQTSLIVPLTVAGKP